MLLSLKEIFDLIPPNEAKQIDKDFTEWFKLVTKEFKNKFELEKSTVVDFANPKEALAGLKTLIKWWSDKKPVIPENLKFNPLLCMQIMYCNSEIKKLDQQIFELDLDSSDDESDSNNMHFPRDEVELKQ